MKVPWRWLAIAGLTCAAATAPRAAPAADQVTRPEEIKSWREVVYDQATYRKLGSLWKDYNAAYPSEYAYANWMYAARYARDPDYDKLLAQGMEKYPSNPTLLYLKSVQRLWSRDTAEEQALLERAAALDPYATDPLFPLVTVYMATGDTKKLDLALQRILSSGVISDAVLDYNYNMLVALEPNAILVTNGDNDTYPGWILGRILNFRKDVAIVNRSLLNTEWYPLRMIEDGLPRFTDAATLSALRKSVDEKLKATPGEPSAGGSYGDTLIVQLVHSAERSGRPVYFAKTLMATESLSELVRNGRDLGLVTLVTATQTSYEAQLKGYYTTWMSAFRTGGLDGWRLRQAPETDAARMLMSNYVGGIVGNLGALKQNAPELRAGLFRWYTDHVEGAVTPKMKAYAATGWCEQSDVAEIAAWCKQQGLGK